MRVDQSPAADSASLGLQTQPAPLQPVPRTESAVRSMMRSLTTQFMAVAESGALRSSLRAVGVAAVMTASVAAQAQNGGVLPQRSAAGWGAQLGGILLGEAAREAVNTGNRGVDRVLVGVATEVGRNSGSVLAQQPYGSNGQQTTNQRSSAPMTWPEVDHLDTQALRSVFAYEQFVVNTRGMATNTREYQAQSAHFVAQRREFEAAYQFAARNRQNVQPWSGLLSSLQARPGAVSMAHLNNQAAPMLARLQRAGGPGFAPIQQMQTLDGLRQQMHQRQVMAAPAQAVEVQTYPASGNF